MAETLTSLASDEDDDDGTITPVKDCRHSTKRRNQKRLLAFWCQLCRRLPIASPIKAACANEIKPTMRQQPQPQHQRTTVSSSSRTQFTSVRSSITATTGLDLVPKYGNPNSMESSWEPNPIESLGYLKTTYSSIEEAVSMLGDKTAIFYIYYDPTAHDEMDTSELSNALSDPLLVEALEMLCVCIHLTQHHSNIPMLGFCDASGQRLCELSLFAFSKQTLLHHLMEVCHNAVPQFVRLLHKEAVSRPRQMTVLTDAVQPLEEHLGTCDGVLRIHSQRYDMPMEDNTTRYLGVSAITIAYDSRILSFSQVLRVLIRHNISLQRIICQSSDEVAAARMEVAKASSNITVARSLTTTTTHSQPPQPSNMRHLSAAASYHHLQRSELRFVPMTYLQALRINSILQTPQHMHLAIQCLSPRQLALWRRRHQRRHIPNLIQIPLERAWDIVFHPQQQQQQQQRHPDGTTSLSDEDEAPDLYHLGESPV